MSTTQIKTDNLSLAASISIFQELKGIEMLSPNKAIFCFEQNREIDKLINKFWSNDLMVSPLLYQEKIKELKKRIENQK